MLYSRSGKKITRSGEKMDNDLINEYFDKKIEILEEMITKETCEHIKDYLIHRENVYKFIYSDLKELSGGKL